MIYFPCCGCRYEVSAPDDEVGKHVLCPCCFTWLRVPPPKTNEKIEAAQAANQIYGLRTTDEAKEYKDTIPVYCKLCRTLMYAAPERIGSFQTCPDCGTKTQVRPVLGKTKPLS